MTGSAATHAWIRQPEDEHGHDDTFTRCTDVTCPHHQMELLRADLRNRRIPADPQ